MKRFVTYLFLLSMIFAGNALAGDDTVLAKIGDKKITAEDFERFISSYPPEKKKVLLENPQNKVILLKRMAHVTALADMARAQGLDKNENVKMQIEYYTNEILAAVLMNEEADKIKVTENDMRLYYRMHEDEFRFPETVRARHILVTVAADATDNDRKKAREKAEGILKRIKSGEDFAKLASELSDDQASKSKGGDLGFFPRGRMTQQFEDAVFSLKPGEVSGVIETPFGYHIIRVEEKKAAGISTFEESRDLIREDVLEYMKKEKAKDVLEKAMKAGAVEIHPELISGEKK